MITGATRVAAVIGDPVRHSLSPRLHNAAYRTLGLDWVFVAFEVAAGYAPAALDAARVFGFVGLAVTMPHKRAMAELCDELTPVASALGSVNTITVEPDGQTVGDSTDGDRVDGAKRRRDRREFVAEPSHRTLVRHRDRHADEAEDAGGIERGRCAAGRDLEGHKYPIKTERTVGRVVQARRQRVAHRVADHAGNPRDAGDHRRPALRAAAMFCCCCA